MRLRTSNFRPRSSTSRRRTKYQYDCRGRLTASRSPDGLVTVRELDNLGRAYRTKVYADLNGNYFTAGAEAGELRGQSERDYDERGQVWRSRVYEVNPANGQVGDRLTSTFWYNPRGMLIKSRDANGLFQKSQYDGVGRQVASFIGTDATEDAMAAGLSKYQAAFNVDGDTVIQQSQSIHDKAGNVIVSLSFQRYDNDTTSTGPLTAANSYATGSVNWFDKGGRMTHSASYGHERGAGTRYLFNSSGQIIDANANGIPDEAERDPWQMPFSDDYILTKVMYNAAGRVHERFDNLGRKTVTAYDLLGRTGKVIENYVNGLVGETESDTDRTTMYIYNSAGRLWQQVAVNPKGDTMATPTRTTSRTKCAAEVARGAGELPAAERRQPLAHSASCGRPAATKNQPRRGVTAACAPPGLILLHYRAPIAYAMG